MDKLHCGDLVEVLAVMPRGKTLIKSTPPPLGARGGLKTQVRTIVGVPRPRVALAGMLQLLSRFINLCSMASSVRNSTGSEEVIKWSI